MGGRVAEYLRAHCPDTDVRLMTRRHRPSAAWALAFHEVEADVLDPPSLQHAAEGVHTVIHLAAANEIDSARLPGLAIDVTTKGTLSMLEAAEAAGVSRFVYLSTFRVYGAPPGEPITECTLPRPSHPYAITHYAAEHFVTMFRARGHLETLVLRLSNGYGAPMDLGVDRWSLVFNDLCRQAAHTGRLALTSSGKPHRDFISIRDVGRAVHHFLQMPTGSWEDGVYNLGGECSMSILELAERTSRISELEDSRPVPITTAGGDSPDSWAPVQFDITRLKSSGFRPEHNLDEEISRTLALCKSP